MTVQIINKLRKDAAGARASASSTSLESMKGYYDEEAAWFDLLAGRLEALSVLYLSALTELNDVRDTLANKDSQIELMNEILSQQNDIANAASAWVDGITSDPKNWADREDLAIINAVKRYRGEVEDDHEVQQEAVQTGA